MRGELTMYNESPRVSFYTPGYTDHEHRATHSPDYHHPGTSKSPGNIGAAARAMHNMGLARLALWLPKISRIPKRA